MILLAKCGCLVRDTLSQFKGPTQQGDFQRYQEPSPLTVNVDQGSLFVSSPALRCSIARSTESPRSEVHCLGELSPSGNPMPTLDSKALSVRRAVRELPATASGRESLVLLLFASKNNPTPKTEPQPWEPDPTPILSSSAAASLRGCGCLQSRGHRGGGLTEVRTHQAPCHRIC